MSPERSRVKSKQNPLGLKPKSYQPTKAELRERVHIPTTPEQLAKLVTKNLRYPHKP